jgi:hypothetical protein
MPDGPEEQRDQYRTLRNIFIDWPSQEKDTCILSLQLKKRDLKGDTQVVDPLAFAEVSLDPAIHSASSEVLEVLQSSRGEKNKGPVVLVRGVGGGKTFAMVKLQSALSKLDDVLPVLITFNSEWETDDFDDYKGIFQTTDKIFALAVIARIASVHFGRDLSTVRAHLIKSAKVLQETFGPGVGGEDMISLFLVHLARRKRARAVVLLVDEVVRGNGALHATCGGKKNKCSQLLQAAMLNFKYKEYGLQGAVVLSGLEASVVTATDSGKIIHEFVLSERLDPEGVVDNLFLKDVDKDGSLHSVVPHLPDESAEKCSTAARQALVRVAATLNSMPRGLELAQDEFRCRIDRTTQPRTLVVTPQLIEQVYEGVMKQFRAKYPSLVHSGLPEPDLMFALVYGKRAEMDARVVNGIRGSLFVNSLQCTEFPIGDSVPRLLLRSSIVSLNAAIGADTYGAAATGVYLRRIFEITQKWAAEFKDISAIGKMLEDLAVAWMELRLAVAVQAGKRVVPLEEMLNLKVLKRADSGVLSEYLCDSITLPQRLFPTIQMKEKCYKRGVLDAQPCAALIEELDGIQLTSSKPCVVLRAAEGDCWDHALAFLGREVGEKARPKRIVFFDTKSAQELLRETQSGVTPARDTSAALVMLNRNPRMARRLQKTAALFEDKSGAGLGSVVARGNYLYVYHTTHEGASSFDGNTVIIGRKDAERYFGFMFELYRSMKAAIELFTPLAKSRGKMKKRVDDSTM